MKKTILKILTLVTYLAMVVINYLANVLPINNQTTGGVSNAYQNLFAPAGLTFSIWGLIYLLLAGYVVYQFTKSGKNREELFAKINPFFIISSLSNLSWIFAWHYDLIWLSVLIMAVLLFSLIKIADILRKEKFSGMDKLFIWAPFSVYFGWITVATIANITVFLVSLVWNGFGLADFVWAIIILLVGALIGILRMNNDKNIAYGLVLIWAYIGILIKHFSIAGFNGQYPIVIVTVIACLALFIFFAVRIFYKK